MTPTIHWRVLKAFALCCAPPKGREDLQVIEIRRTDGGWKLAATTGHVALLGHVFDPEAGAAPADALHYVTAVSALRSARVDGELPVKYVAPDLLGFPDVEAACVMATDKVVPVAARDVGFGSLLVAMPKAIDAALGRRKSAHWAVTIGDPLGPTLWTPEGALPEDLKLTGLRLVVMPCRLGS